MSDSPDDILTRPLGLGKTARERRLPRLPFSQAVLGGIACAGLALLVGVVALTGDPRGGEPHATAVIALREAGPKQAATAEIQTPQAAEDAARPPSATRSAQEVEQASGVTVTRPSGTGAPPEPVIIQVPTEPARLAAADPRLVERGRHGPIPKIGPGRLRALDVYARTDTDTSAAPRIAILVTGIGIGQGATAAAITRLPPAISLALAPYASDLDKVATRAREAGHELLLQVPMEPFDYPDSDPGPQTLLTSSRPPENLDRLAWAMSRFPAYVGIVNFMGGKLTSDAAAFEPILREIGARGLGIVDDGTSPRSLTPTLAAKLKTPAARAYSVIDAVPRPDAIDRELARLEAQARQKGFVLASASALPMTIDRIARWSRDLEARGLRLVPVSTALRMPIPEPAPSPGRAQGAAPGPLVSSAAP